MSMGDKVALGTVGKGILAKLAQAFPDAEFRLEDQSHLHAGHAGAGPQGETHFKLHAVTPAFAGKSRIERHRMINALLKDELHGRVHALAIIARAPGEQG
jgi:BolA family transcriptional regulator, general stress-responsive regulator